MKRKAILALAVFLGIMTAETTSAQIVNPSFENGTTGWIVSGLATQSNNSFTKKEGSTYVEKWVSSGNSVGDASARQVLENLEPGRYTLTAGAQNLNQSNISQECSGAKLFAGSASTPVYTPNDYSVEFVHIAGNIEIGFIAQGAKGNWLALDNFRLVRNGDPAIADMKNAIKELLETATKLYGEGDGNDAAALKNEIDNAQKSIDNADETSANAILVYKALQKAIDAYRLANVSEQNPLNYSKYIDNPSFENGTTGWTNVSMARQSNSSFTKKEGGYYMEKWVGTGNRVGDASLSQVVKNLPNGKYKLTVAAQNLNQGNTSQKCDGAVIYAGDATTAVYTAGDYSVTFTSMTGEMPIGFRAVQAGGNWIAVDNFRLYLIGTIDKTAMLEEMTKAAEQAEQLQQKMMNGSVAEKLTAAIANAKSLTKDSSDDAFRQAMNALDEAVAAARESISQYEALQAVISDANATYDEKKNGADLLKAEIEKAEALVKNAAATSAELAAEVAALEKAQLAFNLANATEGTGTPVSVTKTNHYVVTGATEALMRASMVGSNVMELGVCWSTEHNPTVLDNRTTKSFTLNGTIFHVKGLKPATVYYLRPYAMNRTYEVAYGDEVKIVTHPAGTCIGTWDGGAPSEEANTRCRNAIKETIDYFNEWTGIKGFTLSGHYGASTPTADCSYGGWMRIGPNAGNQAIGTVIHETGHGVGVGTSDRWWDTNVHNWQWFGREANDVYHFLENQYTNSEYTMVGDGTHGWGQKATYDWFVNGADKDKHYELQYIGGCALLYGLFVDGLCPTSSYKNGLAGYTYNYDDSKKYYIMCKDKERGLGEGLLCTTATGVAWKPLLGDDEIMDNAAWTIEYLPQSGYYRFKSVSSNMYLSHPSSMNLKATAGENEIFQLMPDRTDVTIGSGDAVIKTHGYWFTWNNGSNRAMSANKYNETLNMGLVTATAFNYADTATPQQWIIISEDELPAYKKAYISTGINSVTADEGDAVQEGIYTTSGIRQSTLQKGINIIRYSDGTSRKQIIR